MRLRKLELKDAPLMLEWMHDMEVTRNLKKNFSKFSIEDAEQFILHCQNEDKEIHRAVVSDEDEYMGTVSLKHIDNETESAEFAVVVRSEAMTKGYAWFAMTELLDLAFDKRKLSSVYWCVSKENHRAIRFYDKHYFGETFHVPQKVLHRYSGCENLKWYSVLAGDDYKGNIKNREQIAGCKVLSIKTIPTVNAGELSFFEERKDFSFSIKRIYYISKVPEGTRRGFHAHKELSQLLFCPYGKIQLVLDNGIEKEEIILNDPSIGILIDRPVWREMWWLEKNSVLCVAASDYYNTEDYIRNYEEFISYVKNRNES